MREQDHSTFALPRFLLDELYCLRIEAVGHLRNDHANCPRLPSAQDASSLVRLIAQGGDRLSDPNCHVRTDLDASEMTRHSRCADTGHTSYVVHRGSLLHRRAPAWDRRRLQSSSDRATPSPSLCELILV